jgi:hypothetical protein
MVYRHFPCEVREVVHIGPLAPPVGNLHELRPTDLGVGRFQGLDGNMLAYRFAVATRPVLTSSAR